MQVVNCSGWTKQSDTPAGVDYARVKGYKFPEFAFTYTERDVVLYSLGIGAGVRHTQTSDETLKWAYEGHGDFSVFPTFGVIIPFECIAQVIDIPGFTFNPMLLLHGETELFIHRSIPTSGTLRNVASVRELYDKGKATIIVVEVDSFDEKNNKVLTNVYTLFIRGVGGFDGPKSAPPYGVTIPKEQPDIKITDVISPSQALLYRLSGDINPLHVDPLVAQVAGFKKPILHGLCTFGFAMKAVIESMPPKAKLRHVKVRMSKSIFPGDKIETSIYKRGNTCLFETKNEAGEVVLSGGIAEFDMPANL